jgi:hypothetical protein
MKTLEATSNVFKQRIPDSQDLTEMDQDRRTQRHTLSYALSLWPTLAEQH